MRPSVDEPFDPIALAILLGLANTIVIAFGLAVAIPERGVAGAIFIFGFIPGMMIGAIEGGIARLTARTPPWVRLILLTPIPVGFVLLMATSLHFRASSTGAAIPTLVAVLILERHSRKRPLVPPARVA
ncbi:MAG TPA: hypothetical protein VMZ53_24625 [Kofleriaceae bacterium]|nr:hypothetical protein [Kofleriaceae bacterium]